MLFMTLHEQRLVQKIFIGTETSACVWCRKWPSNEGSAFHTIKRINAYTQLDIETRPSIVASTLKARLANALYETLHSSKRWTICTSGLFNSTRHAVLIKTALERIDQGYETGNKQQQSLHCTTLVCNHKTPNDNSTRYVAMKLNIVESVQIACLRKP